MYLSQEMTRTTINLRNNNLTSKKDFSGKSDFCHEIFFSMRKSLSFEKVIFVEKYSGKIMMASYRL